MDQESKMNPCDEFDRSQSLPAWSEEFFLSHNRRQPLGESVRKTSRWNFACRASVCKQFRHCLTVFTVAAAFLTFPAIALSAASEKTLPTAPLFSLHPAAEKGSPRFFKRKIELHGGSLELHLARPQESSLPDILVLYASGDGGWFGAAIKMFENLAGFGYPTVGFSARSYMKLLSYGDNPVSVDELRNDYQEIIRAAQASLDLPQTARTILTGWSRGAAFAVLVGSERDFQRQLAGVIAIGLPDKEELKIRIHNKRILVANTSSKHQHMIFDTYQLIPLVAPLPFSLIQSTGDDFLPASEARKLFGSESETDKFFAVESHNHRFSGGTAAFGESLRESMRWITGRISSSPEDH